MTIEGLADSKSEKSISLAVFAKFASKEADCKRAALILSTPEISVNLNGFSPSDLRELARFLMAVARKVEWPLGL